MERMMQELHEKDPGCERFQFPKAAIYVVPASPSAGCVLHIHKALVMLDISILGKTGAESAPGSHYLVTNMVI